MHNVVDCIIVSLLKLAVKLVVHSIPVTQTSTLNRAIAKTRD